MKALKATFLANKEIDNYEMFAPSVMGELKQCHPQRSLQSILPDGNHLGERFTAMFT